MVSTSVASSWPSHSATGAGRAPALLLEPRRAIAVLDQSTGASREMRVETIISHGLERLTPDVRILNVARDWWLCRRGADIELVAPFDLVVARGGELRRFPPRWLEAAATEAVLVVYGVRVGVRAPTGRSYNDDDRRGKLHQSRHEHIVAAGLVRWHG